MHHGRVVKRTGDGSLIEFRNVVDAVRCAIEVQNEMVERNAGLPPNAALSSASAFIWAMWLRRATAIDGRQGQISPLVSEGIAKPRAICLSEEAYRHVSGRLDMEVTDLGLTQRQEHRRTSASLFAGTRRPGASEAGSADKAVLGLNIAASIDRGSSFR